MNKVLNDMLTGLDNQTHDIARWLAAASFVVAMGLSVYVVVWKGQAFDLQQYGIGLSALFAGLGVALKLKESTEPQERHDHD